MSICVLFALQIDIVVGQDQYRNAVASGRKQRQTNSTLPRYGTDLIAGDVRIEDYEGRQISAVELVFEGTAQATPAAQADFLALL
ncbi:MAG TPA: hypothetical protein VJ306_23185, partial [Pyrinomonadaceae bacterium]|nr:hypothetical protein [Pyrinomonadaceae bacterium]